MGFLPAPAAAGPERRTERSWSWSWSLLSGSAHAWEPACPEATPVTDNILPLNNMNAGSGSKKIKLKKYTSLKKKRKKRKLKGLTWNRVLQQKKTKTKNVYCYYCCLFVCLSWNTVNRRSRVEVLHFVRLDGKVARARTHTGVVGAVRVRPNAWSIFSPFLSLFGFYSFPPFLRQPGPC